MIYLTRGLYVEVVEQLSGPSPKPLSSGFSETYAYLVIGLYNPAEPSERCFILLNDQREVRYVAQCHFRAIAVLPDEIAFRLRIASRDATVAPNGPARERSSHLSLVPKRGDQTVSELRRQQSRKQPHETPADCTTD